MIENKNERSDDENNDEKEQNKEEEEDMEIVKNKLINEQENIEKNDKSTDTDNNQLQNENNANLGSKDLERNKEVDIKNIRSFYILKGIFSFLEEKKKLHLIQYNKKYQNDLGYNIEDYKRVSDIYIVDERNGYGKVYKKKEIY